MPVDAWEIPDIRDEFLFDIMSGSFSCFLYEFGQSMATCELNVLNDLSMTKKEECQNVFLAAQKVECKFDDLLKRTERFFETFSWSDSEKSGVFEREHDGTRERVFCKHLKNGTRFFCMKLIDLCSDLTFDLSFWPKLKKIEFGFHRDSCLLEVAYQIYGRSKFMYYSGGIFLQMPIAGARPEQMPFEDRIRFIFESVNKNSVTVGYGDGSVFERSNSKINDLASSATKKYANIFKLRGKGVFFNHANGCFLHCTGCDDSSIQGYWKSECGKREEIKNTHIECMRQVLDPSWCNPEENEAEYQGKLEKAEQAFQSLLVEERAEKEKQQKLVEKKRSKRRKRKALQRSSKLEAQIDKECVVCFEETSAMQCSFGHRVCQMCFDAYRAKSGFDGTCSIFMKCDGRFQECPA